MELSLSLSLEIGCVLSRASLAFSNLVLPELDYPCMSIGRPKAIAENVNDLRECGIGGPAVFRSDTGRRDDALKRREQIFDISDVPY
jgi:hypothetical protein